jgi:tricorn protease
MALWGSGVRIPSAPPSFTQISSEARTLRFAGIPSPDGKRIAHTDRDQKLWVLHLESKEPRLVATAPDPQQFDEPHLAWSPDSQWLAYVMSASNTTAQIHLYHVETGQSTAVTTDRLNSYSPAWHPDGKWLYFLSDRIFRSIQPSPWGPRQPEPFGQSHQNLHARFGWRRTLPLCSR